MVVLNINDKTCYFDETYKNNLDLCNEAIKYEWDNFFIVTGPEGAGKSTFAHQSCCYQDKNFSIDNIVYTPQQLMKRAFELESGSALMWDESITGADIKNTMSRINKTLHQLFTQMRFKRLNVWVLIPEFFDLSKYLAISRSRAMIRVYAKSFKERGYFKFYDKNQKKQLYLRGKKFLDYGAANPTFRGRFTNTWLIDKKEYEQRKADSVMNQFNTDKSNYKVDVASPKYLAECVVRASDIGVSKTHMAHILGYSERRIREIVHLYNIQNGGGNADI